MIINESQISQFLQDLGLEEPEIKVYFALLENGILSTLQIAKISGIPRTSVYRIVQNLNNKGLTEELITQNQTKTKIVDPERLSFLISSKQKNVKRLEENFSEVKNLILQKTGKFPSSTKVLYHHGPEGMKQMLWNLLRTTDEFRGYSYCTPVETTGQKFAVDWAMEFNDRKIKARDFYSNHYQKSIAEFPYPSAISWPTWESRYISPDKLNIDHQIDIYNDVLAFYDWHGGEVFGVEIYNYKIANLQKQMFDLVWKTT